MTGYELIIERSTDEFETVGDGYTVVGRAVPFDRRVRVSDDGEHFYDEEFDPGAFDRDVAKGGRWVRLMHGHRGDVGSRYLGRSLGIFARPDGLYCQFRLEREHPEVEAARAGELRKWSIGAKVYRTLALPGGVQRRMSCSLEHVAATASPQYEDSGVLMVREQHVIERLEAPRLEHWKALLERSQR